MDTLRSNKVNLLKKNFTTFFNARMTDVSSVKVFLFTLVWFYRQRNLNAPIIVEDRHKLLDYVENQSEFSELYDTFNDSLRRISDNDFHPFLNLLNEQSIGYLNEKEFSEFFKYLLYSFLHRSGNFMEVGQSDELNRLLLKLGNVGTNSRIYNPFAGVASIATFLSPESIYIGEEINQEIFFFGKLLLLAFGLEHFDYRLANSLHTSENARSEYDLIVSHPPFRLKIRDEFKSDKVQYASDYLLVEGLKQLGEDGKLVAVLPLGFLSSNTKKEKALRSYLVENNHVEYVVELPSNALYYSNIKSCLLVLRKQKTSSAIKFSKLDDFADAERLFTEDRIEAFIVREEKVPYGNQAKDKVVSKKEVAQNDFSLVPDRYLIGDHFEGEPLGDFAKPVIGTRDFKIGDIGKWVKYSHLKDDLFDFRLELDSIEAVKLPNRLVRKISQDCLLLANRFGKLKPTYFKYEGEPIFIESGIVALAIDESEVFMEYLVQQLHSKEVAEQIDKFSSGTVIPFLVKKDLLSIKVDVSASLEEQKKHYFDKAQEFIDEKRKVVGLENRNRILDILDENSFLRHQIAGELKNMRITFNYIKEILKEKVYPDKGDLYQLTPVNPIIETTLGRYLEILDRDLNSIRKSVEQSGADIDWNKAKAENFDIISFTRKYIDENLKDKSHRDFVVDLKVDETALKEAGLTDFRVKGDPDFLRKTFDNLVSNAEKHAFISSSNFQNRLLVRINPEVEGNRIVIQFINNGKEIPANVTPQSIVRRGSVSGKNAGTGSGVYLINETMKFFKGDFTFERLPNNDMGDFVTSFILTFPLNLEE